jgi:hypothetical protein
MPMMAITTSNSTKVNALRWLQAGIVSFSYSIVLLESRTAGLHVGHDCL